MGVCPVEVSPAEEGYCNCCFFGSGGKFVPERHPFAVGPEPLAGVFAFQFIAAGRIDCQTDSRIASRAVGYFGLCAGGQDVFVARLGGNGLVDAIFEEYVFSIFARFERPAVHLPA